MNSDSVEGSVQPSFPRTSPSHAEFCLAIESGELNDIVRAIFDVASAERTTLRIELGEAILAGPRVVKASRKCTGGVDVGPLLGRWATRCARELAA